MPHTMRDLDRFLRAVHRRWVALRVAETMGLAVLGGCALALLVLPVLLWRGEPALPVVLTAMAVAALAGLIAGVLRRPNLMSAATEAERQLQLADLLSTALLTRTRSPADPWTMTVVATADARCRTLAPNAVVLNRFGARAWGGIGLAAALVLTLGLMSANPHPSTALTTAGRDPVTAPDVARRTPPLASTRTPGETPQRHRNPSDRGEPGVAQSEIADAAAAARASDRASRHAASATDSGGAGMATSPRPSDARRPPLAPSPSPSPTSPDGAPAGGGTSTDSAEPNNDAAANSTVAARDIAATPAWRSPSWPAAREQALSAVRDRRVPDSYRDLVREYFGEKQD